LRFLFVDHLPNTIKYFGNKMIISTKTLSPKKNSKTSFFQSAWGNIDWSSVMNFQIFDWVLNKNEMNEIFEEWKKIISEWNKVKISKFLLQTSFISGNFDIKKQDIIKFIANKLWWVHFDTNRNQKRDWKYKELDTIMESIIVLDKNPIYVEIMSISQDICNSDFFNKL